MSRLLSNVDLPTFVMRVGGRRGSVPEPSGPSAAIFIDFSTGSLENQGTMAGVTDTFTRASTATVIDNEGNLQDCLADEARMQGARRGENLQTYYDSPLSTIGSTANNPGWSSRNDASGALPILEADGFIYLSNNGNASARSMVTSLYDPTSGPHILRLSVVTKTDCILSIVRQNGGTTTQLNFVAGVEQDITFNAGDAAWVSTNNWFGIIYETDSDEAWIKIKWQWERSSGRTDKVTPSEWIPTTDAPVGKYFTTENGNSVDGIVVTEGEGAPITGEIGYLNEDTAINYFLNPQSPITQTISGRSGTHTCWLVGTGSCTLSGGLTGTVTEGNPITGDPAGADVICTIAGSIDRVQFEDSDKPTSFIPNSGTPEIRAADSLPYSGVVVPDSFTVVCEFNPNIVDTTARSAFAGLGANASRPSLGSVWAAILSGSSGIFDMNRADVSSGVYSSLVVRGEQSGGNVVLTSFYNGAQKITNTVAGTVIFSSDNQLMVGGRTASLDKWPGVYKRVELYTSALTDQECIDLSTPGA